MLLSAGGAAGGGTAGAAGAATGGGTGADAAGAGAVTRPAGAGAGTAARPDGAGTGAIAGGAGSAGLASAAGSGAAGDGVRLGSIEVDLSQILPISSIRPGLSSAAGAAAGATGGALGTAGAPGGALGAALAGGGVAARWAITADIIAGDITSATAATATRAGPAIIHKPGESDIGRTVIPVRRSEKQKRRRCDITQRRHARGERLTASGFRKRAAQSQSPAPTARCRPPPRTRAAARSPRGSRCRSG